MMPLDERWKVEQVQRRAGRPALPDWDAPMTMQRRLAKNIKQIVLLQDIRERQQQWTTAGKKVAKGKSAHKKEWTLLMSGKRLAKEEQIKSARQRQRLPLRVICTKARLAVENAPVSGKSVEECSRQVMESAQYWTERQRDTKMKSLQTVMAFICNADKPVASKSTSSSQRLARRPPGQTRYNSPMQTIIDLLTTNLH